MTYLDDIWYLGGSRSVVVHAEFWAWQMPIKYLICIIYAKICPEHFSGTVCPTWMIFGMWVGLGPKLRMVILMEVKGHQRSNGVNYVLWLPYLVKRSPDASWEWWLDGGQRSSEVKWGKLCAMATIFGQKKHWCKLRMMMTLMEVKGHQVKWGKLCAMATIFGQKNWWCKLRMMMTFMEVKGHQRSNMVTYVPWLPYLVNRIVDAS